MGATQAETGGVVSQGTVILTNFASCYPAQESANVVYPFICSGQPNAAPSSTLSDQAYYWVAPFPGKLISVGVCGHSTPGTTTNGAVCQLIRNGALYGGGWNMNSFVAKNGLKFNLAFAAGDYFGIRYGCPYSGYILLTGTFVVQLSLT